jgi:uncharacterized repeat protein (TIGR03803 family)
MRLARWCPFFLIAVLFVGMPQAVYGQAFEVVGSFGAAPDGGEPSSALVQATDGNFYGTATHVGAFGVGTVFKLTPAGTLTTVYDFNGPDGAFPYGGLIQASDGDLYGTTLKGGVWDKGTVFKLTITTLRLTTIHSFSGPDGVYPLARLVEASDGNLYGTTSKGEYGPGNSIVNLGTVFRIDRTGHLTTLYDFTPAHGGDGSSPVGPLIQASDGNFYGTTQNAGRFGSHGTVFTIDVAGSLTTLYSFNGPDGAGPSSGVIEATDGHFYGTTADGGASDAGTIFKLDVAGTLTTVHNFSESGGATAWAGLLQADDGNMYGTTVEGGTSNQGIVFVLHPAGWVTVLHHFNGADGALPYGGLIQGGDGRLYGTTVRGGPANEGVVFRLTLGADLTISAISEPPEYVAPGAKFSVTDTTINQGTVTTTASRTRYYLSPDETMSADDPQLIPGRSVPLLDAGSSSTSTLTVKVPLTVAPNAYTLFACADAASEIIESDEGNNCLAASSRVTVARPDLLQVSVSNPPTVAAPGTKFTLADTVHNPSPVVDVASISRYYLSLDELKNGGDFLLTGKRAIPELAPGATSTGNASVTLPLSVPDGTYYVVGCADDLAKLKEASEANNCAVSSATVLVGWSDLIITEISDPPSTAIPGGKFTIFDTVQNQGTIPAGTSYARYYLSMDGVKNAGDVLLMGTRAVESLASGASSAGSRRVTMPLSTPLGTYRVLGCADDTAKVPENDNANNCRASATTVLIQ